MVTSKFSEAQRNAIDALVDGRRLEVVPVDDPGRSGAAETASAPTARAAAPPDLTEGCPFGRGLPLYP